MNINLFATVSSGVTITVPDDHSKIDYAIGNATDGDTIYVRSGTYYENIEIDKQLSLEGEDPSTTIIFGDGANIVVDIEYDGVFFSGFTVKNGTDGISIWYDNQAHLSNCIITDCSSEGIRSYYADNSSINNLEIYGISTYGIYLERSRWCQLENLTIHNCTQYGIRLRDSGDCSIRNYTGYDNIAGVYVRDCPGLNIAYCNFSSGDNGVQLSDSANCNLANIICYSHLYDGFDIYDCDGLNILNCESYDNLYYGSQVTNSLNVDIYNCTFTNNTSAGLYLDNLDLSWVSDCVTSESNDGIFVIDCGAITICNSTSYNNDNGLELEDSLKFYSTGSVYHNNTRGVTMSGSRGVLVKCNLNANDGIYSTWSEILLRYCTIKDNLDEGASEYNTYMYDARECWWGNETGPYHDSLNPSGTGNSVDDAVQFDPWLTEPIFPETLLSELRCDIRNLNWMVVYPDQVTPKPLGCVAAWTSDWLSSSYVTTKLLSYVEGLDTDPMFVNQVSGEAAGDPDTAILTFGGPFVNPIVKRAENSSTPEADRAPVKFHNAGDTFHFQYKNGTNIPNASLPLSVINHDEDLFIIERYVDGTGRIIMICYGFGWPGTYAAGKFFDKVVFPNLGRFTHGWMVVHWNDSNGDGFVNNPGEGDTYTVIATGN